MGRFFQKETGILCLVGENNENLICYSKENRTVEISVPGWPEDTGNTQVSLNTSAHKRFRPCDCEDDI